MAEEESLAEEQQKKLKLAIERIVPHCTEESEFEEFRQIGQALKKGDELAGEILEGATNFSYRIYLKGEPTVQIFVKVAFDYARWNPDRSAHYDLDRLTTEYDMLRRFSSLLGDSAPVAKPYVCEDIAPRIRMMVAQWAPSHEAWFRQFILGQVDRRVLRQVARFMARVNSEPYGHKDLNNGIKDSFRAIYAVSKAIFHQKITEGEDTDPFVVFGRQVGEERFAEIIDGMAKAYERCDVLLHGDNHVFNVLVEPLQTNGGFGDKGEFFVCDWEMVHAGDKGRDPGTFRAFPMLCAYFLAARGEKQKALDVIDCIQEFWECYVDAIKEQKDVDEKMLVEVYKSSLGWSGLYALIANYMLDVQRNSMPFDLVTEEAGALCLSYTAIAGLKFLDYGFTESGENLSLEQLKAWFKEETTRNIETISEICK